ncbi:MAG: hypothetical protein JXR76_19120, partial [Deltaproteobacteria bacterium]|nr:hypothetical protein [Deltaproteobacteria bacterium]
TSGGAGWWKSPCPDLVRASVGQPAGATRHGTAVKKQYKVQRDTDFAHLNSKGGAVMAWAMFGELSLL